MSKIYRRPMFRGGGPVSSYGNGITAPLVPGYQMGGSINTPRRGLVTQPGGYAGTLAEELAKDGLNNTSAGMGLGDFGAGTTKVGADLYSLGGANRFGNTVAPTGQVPPGVVVKETETATEVDDLSPDTSGPFDEKGSASNLFGELDTAITNEEGNQVFSERDGLTLEEQAALNIISATEYAEKSKIRDQKESINKIQNRIDKEESGNKQLRPGGEDAGAMSVSEIENIGLSEAEKAQKNATENPEISAKDAIRENQALFKELLGSKKARGQDISDMLLRFSGSDGNTIGEKFKNYTKAESAAGPGRSEKINQTASALAINDYVAGKRSKEQGELMTKKIDYELDAKNKYLTPQPGDSNSQALAKIAKAYKIDPNSNKAIKQLIKIRMPGKKVFGITKDPTKIKSKDLDIGINIVTHKGAKTIIEKISETETRIIPFDGI